MLINYGIRILLLVRNGIVDDWASLCKEFGLGDPVKALVTSSKGGMLLNKLAALERAGLIVIEGDNETRDSPLNMKIKIAKNWLHIQDTLGISLTNMEKLENEDVMITKPYFGLPLEWKNKTDLFVIMPFQPSLKPIYEDHMVNVAKSLGLTIARGDDFFTVKSVMSDIWVAINGARAIIADCTERNPNVFYEIGLAHTIGKPVILITQNKDDVPFDIRHIRYIHYEYTPRGMKDFEHVLTKTLQTTLA